MRLGHEMVDNRWLKRRYVNSALRNANHIPPFENLGTNLFYLNTLIRRSGDTYLCSTFTPLQLPRSGPQSRIDD